MTEKTLARKHVSTFKTAVNYLLESQGLSLQMRKLHMYSLHIRANADASFATNHNLATLFFYAKNWTMHVHYITPATKAVELLDPF